MLGKQLRPKTICKYAGCNKLIDIAGYCEKHKEAQKKIISQKKNNRNVDYLKLYNYQWKKVRSLFLKENPLCVICLNENKITPANVVDHIKPHKGDINLFWNQGNYQALCKSCHDYKTAKEDGGFGNKMVGGEEK